MKIKNHVKVVQVVKKIHHQLHSMKVCFIFHLRKIFIDIYLDKTITTKKQTDVVKNDPKISGKMKKIFF
jgi:hypothetical protein